VPAISCVYFVYLSYGNYHQRRALAGILRALVAIVFMPTYKASRWQFCSRLDAAVHTADLRDTDGLEM
jgi:hypothetical protein